MSRNFVPDEKLIDQLFLNDTFAFEEIYHRYFYSLYTYCFTKLNSHEDAKKIVRDIFIALWEKRQTFPVGFSISLHFYTEVRKAVVACIDERLESKREMSFIEKNVIPGFAVNNLKKARQPVRHNHPVPEYFPPVYQQRKSNIQWWNQAPAGISITVLKQVLQKAFNLL